MLATALSSVGTFGDKLRIAQPATAVGRLTLESLSEQPEQTTAERLRDEGFSKRGQRNYGEVRVSCRAHQPCGRHPDSFLSP